MSSAIGYTRLSDRSNVSISDQKADIRNYCDEQGLTLERIYDDGEMSSGFAPDDLDEYQAVRDRVRAADVDVVVIRDKRRLVRDENAVMRTIADFREEGVELHTAMDGPVSLEEPMEAAMEIMRASIAAEEKRAEIEKSIKVTQSRVDDPEVDHGRPRFGMRYSGDGRQQVPGDRYDDVEDILRLRSEGATYEEIAEEVEVSTSTAHRVVERRDWYERRSTAN